MKKYLKLLVMAFAFVFLVACSGDSASKDKKTADDKKVDEKKENTTNKNSKENKEVDKSSEDVIEDDEKEETKETVKEIDVEKYINDLKLNKENRPFSFKLTADKYMKNNGSEEKAKGVTKVSYDGKTLLEEGEISNGSKYTRYTVIENGQKVTYSKSTTSNGERLIKYKNKTDQKNIGHELDVTDLVWKKDWKQSKSLEDGSILYSDVKKDEQIEDIVSTKGFEYDDTKGALEAKDYFDPNTGEIVKFELKDDFSAELELEGGNLGKMKDGPVVLKSVTTTEDIKFEPVPEIKIPEEFLKAEELKVGR